MGGSASNCRFRRRRREADGPDRCPCTVARPPDDPPTERPTIQAPPLPLTSWLSKLCTQQYFAQLQRYSTVWPGQQQIYTWPNLIGAPASAVLRAHAPCADHPPRTVRGTLAASGNSDRCLRTRVFSVVTLSSRAVGSYPLRMLRTWRLRTARTPPVWSGGRDVHRCTTRAYSQYGVQAGAHLAHTRPLTVTISRVAFSPIGLGPLFSDTRLQLGCRSTMLYREGGLEYVVEGGIWVRRSSNEYGRNSRRGTSSRPLELILGDGRGTLLLHGLSGLCAERGCEGSQGQKSKQSA